MSCIDLHIHTAASDGTDTPRAAVFRHAGNRKWFALVMEVPRDKLGLAGTEKLDIVNFKCDPILIASLRGETGIFPAYHMNKASWITAAATKISVSGLSFSSAKREKRIAIITNSESSGAVIAGEKSLFFCSCVMLLRLPPLRFVCAPRAFVIRRI